MLGSGGRGCPKQRSRMRFGAVRIARAQLVRRRGGGGGDSTVRADHRVSHGLLLLLRLLRRLLHHGRCGGWRRDGNGLLLEGGKLVQIVGLGHAFGDRWRIIGATPRQWTRRRGAKPSSWWREEPGRTLLPRLMGSAVVVGILTLPEAGRIRREVLRGGDGGAGDARRDRGGSFARLRGQRGERVAYARVGDRIIDAGRGQELLTAGVVGELEVGRRQFKGREIGSSWPARSQRLRSSCQRIKRCTHSGCWNSEGRHLAGRRIRRRRRSKQIRLCGGGRGQRRGRGEGAQLRQRARCPRPISA